MICSLPWVLFRNGHMIIVLIMSVTFWKETIHFPTEHWQAGEEM